jgi:hypothetical protein
VDSSAALESSETTGQPPTPVLARRPRPSEPDHFRQKILVQVKGAGVQRGDVARLLGEAASWKKRLDDSALPASESSAHR